MKKRNAHMNELRENFLQEASDLITKHKIDLEGLEVKDLFVFGYNDEENYLTIGTRGNLSDELLSEAEYIINHLF